VAFSLDGAVEGIVSSEKKQEKLHDAVAVAMGVTSQDLAISVTPGSLNVEASILFPGYPTSATSVSSPTNQQQTASTNQPPSGGYQGG
jgi:co-chaperonin GroES (HSP10)